jgi:hypothetical protein
MDLGGLPLRIYDLKKGIASGHESPCVSLKNEEMQFMSASALETWLPGYRSDLLGYARTSSLHTFLLLELKKTMLDCYGVGEVFLFVCTFLKTTNPEDMDRLVDLV